MTKRGMTVDVSEQICPDKWKYEFDGVNLIVVEEFGGDISDKEMADIAKRWNWSVGRLVAVSVRGRVLEVTMPCELGWEQEHAVTILAIEGIWQANVLGLTSRSVVFNVLNEILTNLGNKLKEGG